MPQIKRPSGMGDMESLITYKNINCSRWYPISINDYKCDVSHGIFGSLNYSYRSNIAYNLQYLEYIELQLRELNVSDVIRTMLFKNFVVVTASIIEIVFYHIAKVNGKIKLRTERQVYRQDVKRPSEIQTPSNADKFTLYGYEILSTGVEDLTRFEQLISIVRDNNLLIDTDLSSNKEYLKLLRKLRNKIHLTTANCPSETDYSTFYFRDYLSAKFFLLKVLRDSLFGKDKQVYFPKMYDAVLIQIQEYKNNENQIYLWIN